MYISTNDYVGNISMVIPTGGCNIECGFCHNIEYAGDFKPLRLAKIKEKIIKNKEFIDAVTITGGEPLLHSGQLSELFGFIKKQGLKIKLDTNGSLPGNLKDLVKYVDYVALDVKTSRAKYHELTGANIYDKVLKSMKIVNDSQNIFLECRITYHPSYVSLDDLVSIANDVECDVFTLQQFRGRQCLDDNFVRISDTSHSDMLDAARTVREYYEC
jgi:pyruvate formate lyase activating enzyme